MPSSLPKRRRRPIAEWRSPSFVDITNVQSFAHPKGGARATQRANVRRQADELRLCKLAPAVPSMRTVALADTGETESLLSAGDKVNALYTDGTKYPATINKVYRSKRQYLVDWADGDSSHRNVRFEDVSIRPTKRHRVAHAPVVAQAQPASSGAHAGCTTMVDQAAGLQKAAGAALLADEEGHETNEKRWNSKRLAQLCGEVGRIPVKHSISYWSQVADCMRREHNMAHVQPAQCQQAYTSRFPTPTKRRRTVNSQVQKSEGQTRKPAACIAGFLSGAEPGGVEEAARMECAHGVPGDPRPAACPPRPGTIKWKSYVRAVLAESDRNYADDVFAHHTEGNDGGISRTSVILAAQAARSAVGTGGENGPTNADEDPEEEHEFFTVVTEQQRRDMDGYLALLQRRGRGGSVFRGGKAFKTRY